LDLCNEILKIEPRNKMLLDYKVSMTSYIKQGHFYLSCEKTPQLILNSGLDDPPSPEESEEEEDEEESEPDSENSDDDDE
jgi:hypothetical protein